MQAILHPLRWLVTLAVILSDKTFERFNNAVNRVLGEAPASGQRRQDATSRTPGPHRARLDGKLSAGGSAIASIWSTGSATGADHDTGRNVTVYDDLLKSGKTLAAGTQIHIEYYPGDNRWYVTAAKC